MILVSSDVLTQTLRYASQLRPSHKRLKLQA